jgi:AcrR family transcriptional regulator
MLRKPFAAIKRHTLRLFCEQAYDATTVNLIAEAAEISPSTFFRYFPTKEDVMLFDPIDPILFAGFAPRRGASIVLSCGGRAAPRWAILAVFAQMFAKDLEEQRKRGRLNFSVPELSRRTLGNILVAGQQMATLVATRVGRRPDNLAVVTFVGAVLRAMVAAMLPQANDLDADYLAMIDTSLGQLDAGPPL